MEKAFSYEENKRNNSIRNQKMFALYVFHSVFEGRELEIRLVNI